MAAGLGCKPKDVADFLRACSLYAISAQEATMMLFSLQAASLEALLMSSTGATPDGRDAVSITGDGASAAWRCACGPCGRSHDEVHSTAG